MPCEVFSEIPMDVAKCQSVRHGLGSTIAGYDNGLKVCLASTSTLSMLRISITRDPSRHDSLQDAIEHQSTALYATARLWDDGIIKPTDTRSVLGLALALSSAPAPRLDVIRRTTWDGDEKGFGVFRM